MAGRINTRFLLIVIIVIGVVGAAGGGFIFYRMQTSAPRHARLGEEFASAGDFVKAKISFGRAVAKAPNSMEYLQRLEDVTLKITPNSANDALQLFGDWVSILGHAASHHPTEPEHALRFMEEVRQVTLLAPGRSYYEMIERMAQEMQGRTPESDPAYAEAFYYLGFARYSGPMQMIQEETQTEAGRANVVKYLEKKPDSDRGWSLLAIGRLAESERQRRNQFEQRADALLEEARADLLRGLEKVPDGPELLLTALDLARLDRNAGRAGGFTDEQVASMAGRLVAQLEKIDSAWLTGRTAVALEILKPAGTPSPLTLLEAHLERHPDDQMIRLQYAEGQFQNGDATGARTTARQILDAPMPTVSLNAMRLFDMKASASSLLLNMAVAEWEREGAPKFDPANPSERIKEMEGVLAGLTTALAGAANDPRLILGQGQVAYCKGDYATASGFFDRLIREDLRVTAQTLVYSAVCLEQQGQLGLARTRLLMALTVFPKNTSLLFSLARVEGRMRLFDESKSTLEKLFAIEPEHVRGKDLLSKIDEMMLSRTSEGAKPIDALRATISDAMQSGDLEAGLAAADAYLGSNPDDLNALEAKARLEAMLDRREEALRTLDRCSALAPDEKRFQAIRESLTTDDPVESWKRYFAGVIEDPASLAIETMSAFRAFAVGAMARAETMEAVARGDDAAELRRRADEFRKAADAAEADLARIDPDSAGLVLYRFQSALDRKDWAGAEAQLVIIRTRNLDRAEGFLAQASMAKARDDINGAILAYQSAVERIPYHSSAWQLLASTQLEAGNVRDAIASYEEAYAANPTNLGLAMGYARTLQRNGNPTRALEVMRVASRIAPDHREIREYWLLLEEVTGNSAAVFRERQRIRRERPTDLANNRALAGLLVRTEPSPAVMLDEKGELRFGGTAWTRLKSGEQREVISATRKQWQREAESIIASIRPEGSGTVEYLEWAILAADLSVRRGDRTGASQVIQKFVDEAPDDRARFAGLLVLGNLHLRLEDAPAAISAFERARDLKYGSSREPEYYLAAVHADRGEWAESVPLFEAVRASAKDDRILLITPDFSAATVKQAVIPSRTLDMQIVNAKLKAGDAVGARTLLERVMQAGGGNLGDAMLEVDILQAEMDQAFDAGDASRGDKILREINQRLAQMQKDYPAEHAPLVRQAQHLGMQFERTRNALTLDDALGVLARADEVRPDQRDTSEVRHRLLLLKGDTAGALKELTRMLDRSPAEDSLRSAIITLLLRENRERPALELIDKAVTQYGYGPGAIRWLVQKGDIQLNRMKDVVEAARSYYQAYEISKGPAELAKYCGALLIKSPPEYRPVANEIRSNPEAMESEPTLRLVYARALMGLEDRSAAMDQVREAFMRINAEVSSGRMAPPAMGEWIETAADILGRDRPEAVADLVNEYTQNKPGAPALLSLGVLWRGSGRSDGFERALALQEQATTLVQAQDRTLFAAVWSEYATSLQLLKRFEEAASAFERVLQVSPTNYVALNNLAYLLAFDLNRPQDGLRFAQRAVDTRANDWAVLDTLGSIQRLTGDLAGSEATLRRSIGLVSTAANNISMARTLVAARQFDRARTHLETAAALAAAQTPPNPGYTAEITEISDDIRKQSGNP